MNLKEMGKRVVASTAKNPVAWSLYKLCGRFSKALGNVYGHAHFTREVGERDQTLRQLARAMFPEPVVSGGPFKGMLYPSAQAYGSALLPKLLGSYESELHPALEEMFAKNATRPSSTSAAPNDTTRLAWDFGSPTPRYMPLIRGNMQESCMPTSHSSTESKIAFRSAAFAMKQP
jgi:hypothetical protein